MLQIAAPDVNQILAGKVTPAGAALRLLPLRPPPLRIRLVVLIMILHLISTQEIVVLLHMCEYIIYILGGGENLELLI